MIKKISSLKELSNEYDTFFFDQWGVVHDGKKIFQDAELIFKYLQNLNKKIFIISNSGKRGIDNVNRLKQLGADYILKSPLITSGDVCYDCLINKKLPFQNLGNKYFVIATDYPLLENTSFDKVSEIEMSDFLLLSSTTGFQNFEILDSIFKTAIKLQLPLICSNPDILGISGDSIHPSTGDLAIKYKRMGGVAFVIGKPGLEIFQHAYELSQCEKSKILMIGDSLFNDIAGANSFKIDSLLITSGIHRKEFLQNMNDEDIIGEIKSDYQTTGFPEYIMERLQ